MSLSLSLMKNLLTLVYLSHDPWKVSLMMATTAAAVCANRGLNTASSLFMSSLLVQ